MLDLFVPWCGVFSQVAKRIAKKRSQVGACGALKSTV